MVALHCVEELKVSEIMEIENSKIPLQFNTKFPAPFIKSKRKKQTYHLLFAYLCTSTKCDTLHLVWFVWFLNFLVNYYVISRTGPKTERLTLLHAATH